MTKVDLVMALADSYGNHRMTDGHHDLVDDHPHTLKARAALLAAVTAQAAEVEALKTEAEVTDMTINSLSNILEQSVNALRGVPETLHLHSWHNLPELIERRQESVADLRASTTVLAKERDALQARVLELEQMYVSAWKERDAFAAGAQAQPTITAEIFDALEKHPLPQPAKPVELQALYDELIFAVRSKYPDETRHQTALRYIRRMEEPSTSAAAKERT